MTLRSVLQDAMQLPARERETLAEQLWRSVVQDARGAELTPAQAEDLKRRLAEDAAGTSDPRDAEEFLRELEK